MDKNVYWFSLEYIYIYIYIYVHHDRSLLLFSGPSTCMPPRITRSVAHSAACPSHLFWLSLVHLKDKWLEGETNKQSILNFLLQWVQRVYMCGPLISLRPFTRRKKSQFCSFHSPLPSSIQALFMTYHLYYSSIYSRYHGPWNPCHVPFCMCVH